MFVELRGKKFLKVIILNLKVLVKSTFSLKPLCRLTKGQQCSFLTMVNKLMHPRSCYFRLPLHFTFLQLASAIPIQMPLIPKKPSPLIIERKQRIPISLFTLMESLNNNLV